jgi:hypothetical protein
MPTKKIIPAILLAKAPTGPRETPDQGGHYATLSFIGAKDDRRRDGKASPKGCSIRRDQKSMSTKDDRSALPSKKGNKGGERLAEKSLRVVKQAIGGPVTGANNEASLRPRMCLMVILWTIILTLTILFLIFIMKANPAKERPDQFCYAPVKLVEIE